MKKQGQQDSCVLEKEESKGEAASLGRGEQGQHLPRDGVAGDATG